MKTRSSLYTILFDYRWPLLINHRGERPASRDGYKWPIRKGWMITYGIILFTLLAVELYAVFTKDWSATLTHQFLALVERYPIIGVPALIFLVWLLWHFALPILGIWRDWWKNRRLTNRLK